LKIDSEIIMKIKVLPTSFNMIKF